MSINLLGFQILNIFTIEYTKQIQSKLIRYSKWQKLLRLWVFHIFNRRFFLHVLLDNLTRAAELHVWKTNSIRSLPHYTHNTTEKVYFKWHGSATHIWYSSSTFLHYHMCMYLLLCLCINGFGSLFICLTTQRKDEIK